jgi:hypothetical protein
MLPSSALFTADSFPVGNGSNTVVEQLTHNPKFGGIRTNTPGTGKERVVNKEIYKKF